MGLFHFGSKHMLQKRKRFFPGVVHSRSFIFIPYPQHILSQMKVHLEGQGRGRGIQSNRFAKQLTSRRFRDKGATSFRKCFIAGVDSTIYIVTRILVTSSDLDRLQRTYMSTCWCPGCNRSRRRSACPSSNPLKTVKHRIENAQDQAERHHRRR